MALSQHYNQQAISSEINDRCEHFQRMWNLVLLFEKHFKELQLDTTMSMALSVKIM